MTSNIALLTGDAETRLREMPDSCVHVIVTSPPYFGLRQYGADGEIGLEQKPSEYIAKLVTLFRECRRVLREDGSCWIVIGDSYARDSSVRWDNTSHKEAAWKSGQQMRNAPNVVKRGFKAKDLLGIPWMLAFALRDDGWYLREELPWLKLSCMPESVRDRCTRQHETIFRLTKSPNCFFDWFAIAEDAAKSPQRMQASTTAAQGKSIGPMARGEGINHQFRDDERLWGENGLRNPRSVWQINPEPFDSQMCLRCGAYYAGAAWRRLTKGSDGKRVCTCGSSDGWTSHFAVFPSRLVSRALRATTPDGGCCARCGTPYVRRLSEKEADPAWLKACGADAKGGYGGSSREGGADTGAQDASATKARILAGMRRRETVGFRAQCKCPQDRPPVPALVLDPFSGAGTTALACARLGRDCVGIDLKTDYHRMAVARLRDTEAKCLDGDGTRLSWKECTVHVA